MSGGYLHMTMTRTDGATVIYVECRCGWSEEGFSSTIAARAAGDEHLAVANAPTP